MKKIRTAYIECFNEIWDYYFKQDDLIYSPVLLIGVERQNKLASDKSIQFYNREDVNNLDVKIDYKLTDEEVKAVEEIAGSIILFKMFHRNLFDETLDKKLYKTLVYSYARFWYSIIKKHDLQALVLHEMPHIPYSYIGYLIFKKLGLQTIFSTTFPIRGKCFLTDSIENYGLFQKYNGALTISEKVDLVENDKYHKRLAEDFSIPKYNNSKGSPSLIKVLLIILRNVFFPKLSKRLHFKVIYKNKFTDVSDREFHKYTLSRIINKYRDRKLYMKLASEFREDENKLKLFFALHYEPELAVYPLAGINFNQFEIIKDLSNKLGDKGIIYIKEHPWVFNFSKPTGIIRGKQFYNDLVNLKNVKILDYKLDLSKLIYKLDLMVTLTGTIGWEAALLKIPVLYYGYPWYSGLPGTRRCDEKNDIDVFMKESKNEFKITDYKRVYEIMNSSILDVTTKLDGLSKHEFQEKVLILKSAVEKFYNEKGYLN